MTLILLTCMCKRVFFFGQTTYIWQLWILWSFYKYNMRTNHLVWVFEITTKHLHFKMFKISIHVSLEIFKSIRLSPSPNHLHCYHHLMFVRTSAWRRVPIIFTSSPRKICRYIKVVTKVVISMILNLLVMKTKSSRVPRRGQQCNRHSTNMPSLLLHTQLPETLTFSLLFSSICW